MKTPREAFRHAIQAFEGLYQDMVEDVGNIIRLPDGTIFPPKNARGQRVATVAARRAAARKHGSVVIGTMRGVTPDVWAAFKGIPAERLTPEIMRGITLDDAADLYDAFYYRGPGFDRLGWHPATEVLADIGWGSGPAVAIKMLQRMIGEHPDGVIGPRTIARYSAWLSRKPELDDDVNDLATWRCQFYRSIAAKNKEQIKFLNGWLRRANYYRPTNQLWWQTWMGADDLPPPVQQPDAAPKPAPVTPEETVQKEAETNKIVQGGTVVGSLLASMGGFFKIIPPWALGIAVLALVAVGALWALRSFGIIKRSGA